MMRGGPIGTVLAHATLVLSMTLGTLAIGAAPSSLQRAFGPDGVIVLLGDSITYAGPTAVWLEQSVRQATVDPPTILNLGLPSETVSGLSEAGHAGGKFPRPCLLERLPRTLDQTKPDLVIACYGMNCGIYAPLSDERFSAYQTGMETLIRAARQHDAALILITPPVFDGHVARQRNLFATFDYDHVLTAYSDWLMHRSQGRAGEALWGVDVHTPMAAVLTAKRESNPDFTFQRDAVHPDEAGHAVIAEALIDGISAIVSREFERWDSPSRFSLRTPSIAIRTSTTTLLTRRMRLLRDAHLTAIGHQRPGLPAGKPLDEAWADAAAIDHSLPVGIFRSLPAPLAPAPLPAAGNNNLGTSQ